jgi:hypothetical protein
MNSEKSAKVEFSLWKYGASLPHPRDIETPKGVVDERWIPQSMADSIWRLFEFESAYDRDRFIANPPEFFRDACIKTPAQDFYDKWAGV